VTGLIVAFGNFANASKIEPFCLKVGEILDQVGDYQLLKKKSYYCVNSDGNVICATVFFFLETLTFKGACWEILGFSRT
jgi:hypothetical protein